MRWEGQDEPDWPTWLAKAVERVNSLNGMLVLKNGCEVEEGNYIVKERDELNVYTDEEFKRYFED